MTPADQLTVARAASVPLVAVLYAWSFPGHDYWATAVFCVAMTTDWFDGRLARRQGRASSVGSLLDPIADKVLVLAALVMLVGQGVVPAWMVAAIVVREVLVTGLRQAAIERGVVLAARDLGKLKTWAQAVAAAVAGFAAAGAWTERAAWWTLLVAVVRAPLVQQSPAGIASPVRPGSRGFHTIRRSGPTRVGTPAARRTPPRPPPERPSDSARSSPDRQRREPRRSGCTPPTCRGNGRRLASVTARLPSRLGPVGARRPSRRPSAAPFPRRPAPRGSLPAPPRRAPA